MEDRKSYLGGSEAAAVLGLSRWQTPLEIWAIKTGRIEPKDISGKLPVRLGNMLEDTVAQLFMEDTGKKVRRVNETLFHKKYPYLGANIDRRVVGEDAILEVKTASGWKAREWSGEEIPQEYIIQCHHYLAVTGASKAYIAVLIGNEDFKWKEIDRDDAVINSLVNKEVEFWVKYVIPNELPDIIKADDSDVLYQIFPSPATSDIELSDSANVLIEQIKSMTQDQMALEESIEQNKNQLKAMLGDNEQGHTSINKVTWRKQITKRLDTQALKEKQNAIYLAYLKETSTRVLRYSEITKGE